MVNSGERGSALFVALVTILIVTMSITLVASFIHGRKSTFEIEERNVMIAALVDAAMAETLAELGENNFFPGINARPLGIGTISSKVTISDQGFRRVVAIGVFRKWAATLDAEVSVGGSTPNVIRWQYRQGPADSVPDGP